MTASESTLSCDCAYDARGRVAGERCPECGGVLRVTVLRGPLRGRWARRAARVAAVMALVLVSMAALNLTAELFRVFGGLGLLGNAFLWLVTGTDLLFMLELYLSPVMLALAAMALEQRSAWRRALLAAAAVALLLGVAVSLSPDMAMAGASWEFISFLFTLLALREPVTLALLAFSLRSMSCAAAVPQNGPRWRRVAPPIAGCVLVLGGLAVALSPSAIAQAGSGEVEVWRFLTVMLFLRGIAAIVVLLLFAAFVRRALRA